jgi:hypothetical protein
MTENPRVGGSIPPLATINFSRFNAGRRALVRIRIRHRLKSAANYGHSSSADRFPKSGH